MTGAAELSKAQSSKATFNEARDQHQALIFAYVSRRIRPIEEAEDIVSHVFVDAYKHWGRQRGDPKHWLLGIARRKVCDALRKKRKWWSIQDTDRQGNAMTAFVVAAEVQEATRIVMDLPEDQREAFLLQILEQLSIEEIAHVMKRSPASVNSLLQRARARIQKTIESQTRQGETL